MFLKAPIDSFDDDKYTKLASGTFGSAYISEAVPTSDLIPPWDATDIRFRYPSEHTIQGKGFDLEMQVFLYDSYGDKSFYCLSGRTNLALFFNVATDDNPFFNWLD
jgi:hypothetical protein